MKTEEDLTQQYAEINARLTTLDRATRQYNQLIAQAASAEEIETLAANAESVQAQIDALEEAIRAWDTACEYATVTLSLGTQAAAPAGLESGEDAALGARMGTAFSQMLDFLQDMLVSLAYLAPALFAIAIVAIAIALVRKSKKPIKAVKRHEKILVHDFGSRAGREFCGRSPSGSGAASRSDAYTGGRTRTIFPAGKRPL